MPRLPIVVVVALLLTGVTGRAGAQQPLLTAALHNRPCTDLDNAMGRDTSRFADLGPLQPQGTGADAVLAVFAPAGYALSDLATGANAVAVFGDGGTTLVACGLIPATAGSADAFLGLREASCSGYAGIGWLHDGGAQTQVSVMLSYALSGTPDPSRCAPPGG